MASMRVSEAIRMFRRILPLVLMAFAAFTLSACSSGSMGGMFSSSGNGGKSMAPISFAPIIGAPGKVASDLTGQLIAESKKNRIPVVTEKGQPAEYTVRGYLAASQDKNANKLAYIWDVTDKSGKRVHRILGEETAPAAQGRDAWSSFDQAALQKIATKTAGELAEWLPKQGPASTPQPAVASQQQTAPAQTGSTTPRPAPRQPSGPVMAYVPEVSGAPGDGKKSLTLAIKKQLNSKGIKLASASGANVYTVRGDVDLSRPSGGQQDIKIDWQVLNPSGQRLGTVSQANKVPQGSLDRQWGPIADAAAGAAADGIVKLIPKQ